MSHEYTPSTGLLRLEKARCAKVFKGGAVENLENAPLGKGHKNNGKPLDIETVCYMKPKFAEYDKARASSTAVKIVDLSGVKTLKSLGLEICAADHICNASGDAGIFFGSQNASSTTATSRILNFYKGNPKTGGGIPRFKEKMESIVSRFDETNGALKFPDKTLFILAANLGNCAQKNLAFIGLQDGYVLQRTGMLKEMLARGTDYEKDGIVYLESQGGEKGYDFDNEYEDTDQRELHTVCPHCLKNHIFNWHAFDELSMTRPQDFVPTPPTIIPSLDHECWIAHHRPLMIGKVAGFQRGDENLIKRESDGYIESAILRETHFECFFCGEKWLDDGEFGATRILLDQKSNYIAANPNALPGNIGFNTPQWINRRRAWGKIMLAKLKAQLTNKKGNVNEIKVWWQKVAARTFDNEIILGKAAPLPLNIFDDAKPLPGEKARIASVDIQDKLTNVWIQIWAIGDNSAMRLLWWEHIESPLGLTLEERRLHCKNKCRELFKKFSVQPQNVVIDIAHERDQIFEWAAEDRLMDKWLKGQDGSKTKQDVYYCLAQGDDHDGFKHRVRGSKIAWAGFSIKFYEQVVVVKNNRRETLQVPYRLISKPRTQRFAQRFIEQVNAPPMEIPQRYLADTSIQGLWAQLNSEIEKIVKGKKVWEQIHQRPDHGRDCLRNALSRMEQAGLLVFGQNEFEAVAEETTDRHELTRI